MTTPNETPVNEDVKGDVNQTNETLNQESQAEAAPAADTKGADLEFQKAVQEAVAEKLKDIKSKLDNAYNARDTAFRDLEKLRSEKRDAELKRLQEEGKHKEAFEMQLAEERAKYVELEKRYVELSRDNAVRSILASLDFRNDNARDMAFREIIGGLVQDEKGEWIHSSGASIEDAVKVFVDSEDNAFLFKAKVSSGAGISSSAANQKGESKALLDMTNDELLKAIKAGKVRRNRDT